MVYDTYNYIVYINHLKTKGSHIVGFNCSIFFGGGAIHTTLADPPYSWRSWCTLRSSKSLLPAGDMPGPWCTRTPSTPIIRNSVWEDCGNRGPIIGGPYQIFWNKVDVRME